MDQTVIQKIFVVGFEYIILPTVNKRHAKAFFICYLIETISLFQAICQQLRLKTV